jgi:hypothetical protein
MENRRYSLSPMESKGSILIQLSLQILGVAVIRKVVDYTPAHLCGAFMFFAFFVFSSFVVSVFFC